MSDKHRRIATALLHEIPPPPPRKVKATKSWVGLSVGRWVRVRPDRMTGLTAQVRIGSSLFKTGDRLQVLETDSAGTWLSGGGRSVRLEDEGWQAYLELEAKPRKRAVKDADASEGKK